MNDITWFKYDNIMYAFPDVKIELECFNAVTFKYIAIYTPEQKFFEKEVTIIWGKEFDIYRLLNYWNRLGEGRWVYFTKEWDID